MRSPKHSLMASRLVERLLTHWRWPPNRHLWAQCHKEFRAVCAAEIQGGEWAVISYTPPLAGRPRGSPKPEPQNVGVEDEYEIPNIPENKARSGLGLKRIKNP